MTSFALRGLTILFLLLAVSPAPAGIPTIDPGIVWLLPDTPNQDVGLYVTGGDEVDGFNLYVQVADGGPELRPYMSDPEFVGIDGPHITALDLVTGTIFEDNHEEQLGGIASLPQLRDANIVTAWIEVTHSSIPVRTSGPDGDADPALIATMTFDTTGWFTGTWDLMLTDVFGGLISTDFPWVPSNVSDGEIRIAPVPEPSSLVLLSIGAVGLLLAAYRRRK